MGEGPSHTPDAESPDKASSDPAGRSPGLKLLAVRAAVGGTLMGLANLVPGISGGTMLLASGVYPQFIQGIAEVSTFRFRKDTLVVLSVVVLSAGLGILTLAGPVKTLVVEQRWIMYSLFIGLTLGGIPVVWQLVRRPVSSGVGLGALLGFIPMAALAYLQSAGSDGSGTNDGFLFMVLGGVFGASAMILPGVSGGYLLLVLGLYVPILSGIDALKEALKAGDLTAATTPVLGVVLPVGVGVVVGVLVVSNALKFVLSRFDQPTYGVLLGLLAGSVFGLWPFQEGVAPAVGSVFKGQPVTPELLAELEPEKYPTQVFTPDALQVVGALALIGVGFAVTALVARFGRDKPA